MSASPFLQVAVCAPVIGEIFTYSIPESLASVTFEQGMRVLVPVRNRFHTGIVWETVETVDFPQEKIRPIEAVLDDKSHLSAEFLQLAAWISRYYFCPLGSVFRHITSNAFCLSSDSLVMVQPDIDETQVQTLSETAQTILHWLIAQKNAKVSQLKRRFGISIYRILGQLEVDNWIQIYQQMPKTNIYKMANFVVLNRPDLPATARQKECISLLLDAGGVLPLAELAQDFSRGLIKKLEENQIIHLEKRAIKREIFQELPTKIDLPDPNEEQQQAISEIVKQLEAQNFHRFLLHGVTGSGKTLVFMKAVEACLQQQKSAIILVPEIALTSQMVKGFRGYFGDTVALWHSRLSEGERNEIWQDIEQNKYQIVLGVRSAIFAPLSNLGLIIVDEEHDNAYKQNEMTPSYHARDAAVVRAQFAQAVVVLGSATPSLESYYNGRKEKYQVLTMKNRATSQRLPQVEIVDMRSAETESQRIFSQSMLKGISETLAANQQVMLLQNRRGYAAYLQCGKCGHTPECPNCSVTLTYHSFDNSLRCHHCGFERPSFHKCEACNSILMRFGGLGTQKVELMLHDFFPQAKVLRMDTDTTSHKNAHSEILTRFAEKRANILIGTQMIAKGHDFPHVTFVGVISADSLLNLPDFRAAERTFQLITQVAGRAGRGETAGKVVVQTYTPDHFAIRLAAKHHYTAFAEKELYQRRDALFPPYVRMVKIVFSATNQAVLEQHMLRLADQLEGVEGLLGPVPCAVERIDQRYRWQILIKYSQLRKVQQLIQQVLRLTPKAQEIRSFIDVDPTSII